MSYRWEMGLLGLVALASLGAIVMNVAFNLANASPHPWLIPRDGFDEGVDLDSLMPLIQLVFLVISTRLLVTVRRDHASAASRRRTPAPGRSAPLTH